MIRFLAQGCSEEMVITIQFQIRKLLWMQRYSEVMDEMPDEEF